MRAKREIGNTLFQAAHLPCRHKKDVPVLEGIDGKALFAVQQHSSFWKGPAEIIRGESEALRYVKVEILDSRRVTQEIVGHVAVPTSYLDNCGIIFNQRKDMNRACMLILRTGSYEYSFNRGSEWVADERILEDSEWVAASSQCTPTSDTMQHLFANESEIFVVQTQPNIGVRAMRWSPNEALPAGVEEEIAIHSAKGAKVRG